MQMDFDKMQIIFKAITGSTGKKKSVAKTTELVAALGSSLR